MSLLSISPFIFTTVDNSYGFAPRFILLSAIISIAISFLIYYISRKIKNDLKNYVVSFMCALILVLQVMDLPKAFSELNIQGKFVKNTCQRLSNQKFKIVYDRYVWIYNYFYLVKNQFFKKELNLVGIGTLTRDNLALDLYLYQKYICSLSEEDNIFIPSQGKVLKYRDLRKMLGTLERKQMLKKPDIRLNIKSHILKATIVDKRTDGMFKAYFFSRLGEKNIIFYGIPINKKSFSCPIRKGEQILFLFISPGKKFSVPLVFRG